MKKWLCMIALAAMMALSGLALGEVTGNQLRDGTYTISVESSSSMFRIEECELTVLDGEMTARMVMGGKGYLYVWMGTGEDATGVNQTEYIPFEETQDDRHAFTVPVSALDVSVPCTAFSKKKESWYDRELIFHSDLLPAEAYQEGAIATVESLALEDGLYQVEATLSGGSGRTKIESPATLRIQNGEAFVTVTFQSPYYDYMLVDDQKYLPINESGNSSFEIPLSAFDMELAVKADTVAMSTPHEIDYTLRFDSASLCKEEM